MLMSFDLRERKKKKQQPSVQYKDNNRECKTEEKKSLKLTQSIETQIQLTNTMSFAVDKFTFNGLYFSST